jgi:hypothetical protein
MKSEAHKKHLRTLTSWNNCSECRADTERRMLHPRWVGYRFAHEYLEYAKAGFSGKGVRTWWGGDRLTEEQWRKEFVKALHNRISLRIEPPRWRKLASGYLERLRSALRGRNPNAAYLRQFAAKGASAL